MDISRCLFPTEWARSSSSCSRRACPIYMECSGVSKGSGDVVVYRRSSNFYWPLSLFFFFPSFLILLFLIVSSPSLCPHISARSFCAALRGRRKYFLCGANRRPTNLSSCRDTRGEQLHSSELPWNAEPKRSLPVAIRCGYCEIYERVHARALLVHPLNSREMRTGPMIYREVITTVTLHVVGERPTLHSPTTDNAKRVPRSWNKSAAAAENSNLSSW